MKRSLAWCSLLVVALSSVAAVAVGSETGGRIRLSLDEKPVMKTMAADRLVRVSLDEKPQPLRAAAPRPIVASLESNQVTYVGSGSVKRRIRQTLDDKSYLGEVAPTRAFPKVAEQAPARTSRLFRQSLDDDAPLAAAPKPRPVRTTLD